MAHIPQSARNRAARLRTRQLGKLMVDIATGQVVDAVDAKADTAAVALGRKGGEARARRLTPKQREEAARLAAVMEEEALGGLVVLARAVADCHNRDSRNQKQGARLGSPQAALSRAAAASAPNNARASQGRLRSVETSRARLDATDVRPSDRPIMTAGQELGSPCVLKV